MITLFLGPEKNTIIILKRKLISGFSVQNSVDHWIYLWKPAIKLNIADLEIFIGNYSAITKK
jgi:hypothetical protein